MSEQGLPSGRDLSRVKPLSGLLSEFARTLLTDFSIQDILNHLVQRIVHALPVTGAGVTLISPGQAPQYIAASNEAALRFEQLQTETGEGPCRLAYELGEAVVIADLAVDDRFPLFAPAARRAGLAAAFTFPLCHGDGRLGALDLYRDTTGALDEQDMITAQVLADVTAAYVLNAQARDEARASSDRFQASSLHDPLTGLPNRLLLQERLEHAARRARRSHTNAAVIFADLDRFKQINDTYGHAVGDELLVAVARRLTGLVRPSDTLARVSGDEFVFLCEDLRSASDIEILAPRVNAALAEPFTVSGIQLNVTASVGIAYAGPGEAVTDQLIVNADIAMYQAKRSGGATHQILDLRHARQITERTTLEQDLHTAFSQNDLALAYQPIVRLGDGKLAGVEALLRWTHPVKGPISAALMVSIAEDNGLIVRIGAWALTQACIQRRTLLHAHPDQSLYVAVNLSARQLLSTNFPATVASVLAETGTDPSALVLEMTEGIFLHDGERAAAVLEELKSLGVSLALDDFGTGFCSLNYLRNFPVDILKIDRSFTESAATDPTTSTIVDSVITLAHNLGLTVVAEGVESLEQSQKMRELGCDYAQGFLYAAAMSGPEVVALLELRSDQLLPPHPPADSKLVSTAASS